MADLPRRQGTGRMLRTMSCSSFAICWETTTGPGVTTDGEVSRCPHVAAMAVRVTVLKPHGLGPPGRLITDTGLPGTCRKPHTRDLTGPPKFEHQGPRAGMREEV